MPLPDYVELKKPSLEGPPRLSILKSKFNRIAVKLNGFHELLSEAEIHESITQLKYYGQEIDTYEDF